MQPSGSHPHAQPPDIPPAPPVRSRRWLLLLAGVSAGALLTWIFGSRPSVFFVVITMLGVPAIAAHTAWSLKNGKPVPPKKVLFTNIVVFQLALGVVALAAADESRITLFAPAIPDPAQLVIGLFALLLMLALGLHAIQRSSEEELLRLKPFLPTTRGEFAGWFAVALSAGVVEEIVYRGVLISLLWGYTRSFVAALSLSLAAFAIAHIYQGRKAILTVALFGGICHLLVLATGTLYLAMAVHFLYDLLIGAFMMRHFRIRSWENARSSQMAEQ